LGKWMVLSQVIGGSYKYIVGRQLDMGEPLHGGNVEYAPDMLYAESRLEAEEIAYALNALNGSTSTVRPWAGNTSF
jgi:hypothetical protein